MQNATPIQRFYADSRIFITGATGFLGRILVEKLLRSCSDLKTLYLLIREKKGKDAETRLNELFDDIIFDKMKKENPTYRQQVVAIFGDCSEAGLGISDSDREILISEVTIVFHSAATVNFDAKLQKATFINIRGTRDILALVKEMKQLKFITHVSTAYAHCYRMHLDEKFYDSPITAQQMIALAENMPEEMMDKITDVMIDKYPNTYVLTKSISENLIENCEDLPIAVFRPAIIVSTYKEPISGWINNFYGPQGVSTAAMIGLLRSLHCDENVNANIVPVDMCVNALITIPWECSKKYEEQGEKYEIPIYHYDSNSYQPISWKKFRYLTHYYGQDYPSDKVIGIYWFHLRKRLLWHTLAIYMFHYFPALLIDLVLRVMGKKPMLFDAYHKVHRFSTVISYFSTRNWGFGSKNLGALCDKMAEQDKKLFFCDMRRLDWNEFFKTYLLGCRIYLLKDPLDTLDKGQKRYQLMKVVTFFAVFALMALPTAMLCYVFKT